MTNRNAAIGKDHEEIFAQEIQKDQQTIHDIVRSFSSKMPQRGLKIKIVETEGQHGEKSDVFIRTTGGYNFGANIKSFIGEGFNQVTRITIDNFSKKFDMSYRFIDIIKKLTIAKAQNSRQNWITEQHVDLVINEIKPKAFDIVQYSLLGEDSPELFALIKRDDQIIWIYRMDELLDYLRNSIDVKVTSRGVLMLNECFSIQKKGGNGNHEKHAKDDLRHGGNNLQIKMKCKLLSSRLTPITTIKY